MMSPFTCSHATTIYLVEPCLRPVLSFLGLDLGGFDWLHVLGQLEDREKPVFHEARKISVEKCLGSHHELWFKLPERTLE